MADKSMRAVLTPDKETPGTWRYREVDSDGNQLADLQKGIIGQIYTRKGLHPSKPKSISVEVTFEY